MPMLFCFVFFFSFHMWKKYFCDVIFSCLILLIRLLSSCMMIKIHLLLLFSFNSEEEMDSDKLIFWKVFNWYFTFINKILYVRIQKEPCLDNCVKYQWSLWDREIFFRQKIYVIKSMKLKPEGEYYIIWAFMVQTVKFHVVTSVLHCILLQLQCIFQNYSYCFVFPWFWIFRFQFLSSSL